MSNGPGHPRPKRRRPERGPTDRREHQAGPRHQQGPRPGRRPPGRPHARPHGPPQAGAPPTSWDHVAAWYDKLVGEAGSDYHRHVVLPAAIRMLAPKPGERFLDLACGQGVLARQLARLDVRQVVGVDASPALIAAAKAHEANARTRYVVGDARDLGRLADGRFDAAACLLAVHDIDDVAAVFRNMAAALRPGGRAVIICMHPCLRIPRQSSWGWDETTKTQYRRIDRYATAMTIPMATHPGGDPGVQTLFFHRPLATYLNALSAAGLAVTACEELCSHHASEPGGRSRGENRARREFPLFLALKAVKIV